MFSSQSSHKDDKNHSIAPNLQDGRGNDEQIEGMREGPIARGIESQTARLPSDLFLWAAAGSIVLSLGLQLSGRRGDSNFVGHWAPTFLALGLYNKLVKVAGHDRATH